MRFAEPARDAATPWAEIARPTRPSRLAGVTMAGFRGRGADIVDYLAVPPPAIMLAVEFGDGRLVVEDATGRERHGSLAAGLAPGAARALAASPRTWSVVVPRQPLLGDAPVADG